MPSYVVGEAFNITLVLACGLKKHFTDKRKKQMWIKLHKKKCEPCRLCEFVDTEYEREAIEYNANDNQNRIQEVNRVFTLADTFTNDVTTTNA